MLIITSEFFVDRLVSANFMPLIDNKIIENVFPLLQQRQLVLNFNLPII